MARRHIKRHVVDMKKRKKKNKTVKKLKIIDLKSLNLFNLGVTGLNQSIMPGE